MDSAEERTVIQIRNYGGILKVECDCQRRFALEDFLKHLLVCQAVTRERRKELLSVWDQVMGDSCFRKFLQKPHPAH